MTEARIRSDIGQYPPPATDVTIDPAGKVILAWGWMKRLAEPPSGGGAGGAGHVHCHDVEPGELRTAS